ncbi:maltooligosyl trehalose hydrolase [Raineyella antarctica]|uniref:Malto-oligosyltrehalose trehalohydrolase n=1 Tax=Raineyella antarctica TaxID=1577474 RepID=A0A1G6HVS2_9ACTN|nr:malto-oligosyltrehalose trehalohydrolase [Raineyella antarctica]SDB98290.1 maltooligosyl trehalose hydrolase [Raineyella antarctica]
MTEPASLESPLSTVNVSATPDDTRPDFAVWAPRPARVRLWTRPVGGSAADPRVIDMVRAEDGWWEPDLPAGGELDYGYLLDDDPTPRPDPRTLRQPYGVHGVSRTYDPGAYDWADEAWTGRQLAGSVIYELHVGTFTPEGTLDAAIGRLDHLVDVGVDVVELMPVAAFNGPRGWGYDGVHWYCVHEPYGGPQAYQRFVDACHARGLAVMQDVVYNHWGPSGNYLPLFAPYLDEATDTPWGSPVNLDGPESDEVRRYVIDNARTWLRDFHVDGLRIDAVHALSDPGQALDILEELASEVDALSAFLGRPLALVAESDQNNPRLFVPREAGGYGLSGQWADDFHHAVVANLTGEVAGYYADFADPDALAYVLAHGFLHDGTFSTFRGRRHGRPLPPQTPGWRLVVCADNHDQIGNRAAGDRLRSRLDERGLALAAVLTLTSPFTPMIFMGEEWGASTPWAFFTSHPEEDLARAVTEGRRAEFARMDWDHGQIPDPQVPQTFEASVLDWSEPGRGPYAEQLELVRNLLLLRRSWPDLGDPRLERTQAYVAPQDEHLVVMERGERIIVAVNLGERTVDTGLAGELLLGTGEVSQGPDGVRLGSRSAVVLQRS